MMRLYFVRHGQSENNLLWVKTGSSEGRVPDPALTEVGRHQAGEVARFMDQMHRQASEKDRSYAEDGRFHVTHCYTSLMARAVATGHRIAEALDMLLHPWIDIHESGGMYHYDPESETYHPRPGLTRAALAARYPRLVLTEEVGDDGWWNRELEPREARAPRAQRVLDELLARHGDTDDEVVFVSHGGFFNHLLRAILDIAPDPPLWFGINNASLTRIDFNSEERFIAYLNRTDYLPEGLIT